MTFDEYQKATRQTAIYPPGAVLVPVAQAHQNFPSDVSVSVRLGVLYPTLGLVNEAGEVAGKIKKVMRDKHGKIDEETKTAISHELGDTFWYLVRIADELGLSMEDIAEQNVAKLTSRKERGVIKGDGDNR